MKPPYKQFVASAMCLAATFSCTAFVSAAPDSESRENLGSRVLASSAREEYRRIGGQVEENLRQHVLAQWFPRAVDEKQGGFFQFFAEDWTRGTVNTRHIVYQSRLTWLASQAALRYPQEREKYRQWARHGVRYLQSALWDKERGGFYWAVDENGVLDPERGGEKHAYGNAFGIYAAAAAYRATNDREALQLGQRAFTWLDAKAHDDKNGGYYEALTRDGSPILQPSADLQQIQADAIGTRYGFKSMNTHIHLLEAFSALYEVWPDAKLRTRLQETFNIVRDKIVVEPVGAMNLYFTPDWRAVPDHDSFGHDVETAYLLVEASHALGLKNDNRTWNAARRLVDHALDFGWDSINGGFYDAGSAFGKPTATTKIWWVQAEGLNALLLMHEKFGAQTPRYWNAFPQQWDFIRKRQVDYLNGGWYPEVTEAGAYTPGRNKSDSWTEAYHQGRALLNVSSTLLRLAESKPLSH